MYLLQISSLGMSNNLVSQQLSVQSIQMGQLEHISNKLDSSMQMGLMESRILDPALQQMSMSNMQMGRMGPGQSSTGTLSQQDVNIKQPTTVVRTHV
uniref:Uncharacterized protein n=1 Tax=Salix viminalis TaxID=40686 RepID=A0A6N2L3P9_SALVM